MFALDGTIGSIRRWLPPALIPDTARADVESVAAQLPASLTNCFYFEAPLGDGAPRVDLIVRVDRAASATLASNPRADGVAWQRVAELATQWRQPGSVLEDGGQVMWLEFDVEPGAASRARDPAFRHQPGVFMDFTPFAAHQPSIDARLELVRAALAPLVDPDSLASSATTLRRCLSELPPDAAPLSVGVLLPRDTSTIRVCLLGLTPTELPRFLASIGWPGDIQAVEQMMRTVDMATAHPQLSLVHLDLRGSFLPRIGIEYQFERRVQIRGVVPHAAFLDRLVTIGLCTTTQRDALLAWPGCRLERLPHELWPSLVARRLNHVKLVISDGQPTLAKAYLRLAHTFAGPLARPATPRVSDSGCDHLRNRALLPRHTTTRAMPDL